MTIPSRFARCCAGSLLLTVGATTAASLSPAVHNAVTTTLSEAFGLTALGGLGMMASCVIGGTKKRRHQKRADPLDVPVMHWSKYDVATLRDLLSGGVIIQGKSGSGKSSGPGDTMMRALVALPRSGGLIRCAKPEDARHIHEIFREAGRLDDLLLFSFRTDCQLRFNVLDFIMWHGGGIRDVVHTLTTIGETIGGDGESKAGEDGAFWEQGRDRLLYRAVSVLKLAGEAVSGPNIQKLIMTAAGSREEMADAHWQQKYNNHCMQRAYAKRKSPMEDHEFQQDADFWLAEYPAMAEKTRSSLVAHVMNLLQVFNSGLVRELLSTTTNVSPADMFAGKWIMSDMPRSQEGRIINAALHYTTQRAVLRREAKPGDSPVFIWVDEYQDAANSFDAVYLAQCRSHLGAMVCLTQSVPGLYAQFRGRTGKSQAEALLSNFATQIFCACDPLTADYGSKWLGDAKETFIGGSMAPPENLWAELTGHSRFSGSFSEQYQPILRPNAFMSGLRTGGPMNRMMVDAIVVRTDRPFANGQHYLKASFKQQ